MTAAAGPFRKIRWAAIHRGCGRTCSFEKGSESFSSDDPTGAAGSVQFNAIHRSNRLLLWFNAVHLLMVVLLPFSTGLLAEFNDRPLAVILYGLNIIGCSLTLIAIWLYATWGDKSIPHHAVVTTTLRLAINPVICAIALAIAFVSTRGAILLYVATPVWYIITGPERTAAQPGFWPFSSMKRSVDQVRK